MGKIQIYFGIYNFNDCTPYHFEGYYHVETRIILTMCEKLQNYLLTKAIKFNTNYGIREFGFTLGRDAFNHIETVAVAHPYHDEFDAEIGEEIVIGRIKRMRGELRLPYDLTEHKYTKKKDGSYHDDGLKYPFIYKMTKEGDNIENV